VREVDMKVEADYEARQRDAVDEFRASGRYFDEVTARLRPEIQRSFAQVHDYKQFVQQITQNVDVMLEHQFPGMTIDQKVEKASHEAAAIYYAALVMDEKLDAALYLLNPEAAHQTQRHRAFRLHGVVTKYRKIYSRAMRAKRVKLELDGTSWAIVYGDPIVISIIPHTLIDNAVKYAPAGSSITLRFTDEAEAVRFEVESLGPALKAGEDERIFDPFYRGENARAVNDAGAGYGLASAQHVAGTMGTKIEVAQRDVGAGNDMRLTVFSVRIPLDEPLPPQGPQEKRAGPTREKDRRAKGSRSIFRL
jgi:signal transduction histidine kinase